MANDEQDRNRTDTDAGVSRRSFIKGATTATVGVVVASQVSIPGAWAAGSDEIRVGLIGAGGRGTGAVLDALQAAKGVRLVAIAELFADRLEQSRKALEERFPKTGVVKNDRAFVGLDGYKQVIASDANYIILATPPGFRPLHLKAAVEAEKHIFTEKPVAVDGPGIRTCFSLVDVVNQKKLGLGSGLQRHHQAGYIETVKRIHDGAIGDIVSGRAYWNQGALWNRGRKPEWSDTEWQLRNWYYFTWLCGDHIVEQHVHNIDVVNWVMRAHPVKAMGTGGRQVRTSPEYGHIYDHFAIDFEYENGVRMFSMCRQQEGCANSVSEAVVGTNGSAQVDKYTLKGANAWQRARGKDVSPYQQEHTDLIAAIRKGEPYNELQNVTEATLTAIMGREAAYTGKIVTWDDALNSEQNLMPDRIDLSASMPTPPVPMPGEATTSSDEMAVK
jgi:myo-inositol 2-dehydrogenase / D-chiro-inositol 1-dehydrogenase